MGEGSDGDGEVNIGGGECEGSEGGEGSDDSESSAGSRAVGGEGVGGNTGRLWRAGSQRRLLAAILVHDRGGRTSYSLFGW